MEPISSTLGFKISNFNIVAACLGGFLSLFGLVSYLLKERYYLGEAVVSMIAGIIFGPPATNLIKPLEYAQGDEVALESITLYFTRLVLGVQLVLAGIQLPSRYLRKEWKSLSLLLGPGMCAMWITTSLLVWALVPHIPFLFALALGACVTPTDPVLSNSIVKGKFADKNIPKSLQKMIICESGVNDGLGYPFLFLPLYLIRYVHDGGIGQAGNAGTAIGYWFGITWGYEIIMSILYGVLVGYVFRIALRWAEDRKYVDRESFLVFAITIALFIVGTLGMLGSDDVLACFIAGNVFTWDDWFRLETQDDSFQPTIDMLLNVSIFVWYGAVLPWNTFLYNDVLPIYRMIPLAILILIFRRIPIIWAMHHRIHQIEDKRQALFTGWFGPIGVSAIFYLYTTREYLAEITVNGAQRADAAQLSEIMNIFVWFMMVCSVIVHGLSVPVGKLGLYLPRSISRASTMSRSMDREGATASSTGFFGRAQSWTRRTQGSGTSGSGEDAIDVTRPFQLRRAATTEERTDMAVVGVGAKDAGDTSVRNPAPPRKMWRIGGSIIQDDKGDLEEQEIFSQRGESSSPRDTTVVTTSSSHNGLVVPHTHSEPETSKNTSCPGLALPSRPQTPTMTRSIRFGDE